MMDGLLVGLVSASRGIRVAAYPNRRLNLKSSIIDKDTPPMAGLPCPQDDPVTKQEVWCGIRQLANGWLSLTIRQPTRGVTPTRLRRGSMATGVKLELSAIVMWKALKVRPHYS